MANYTIECIICGMQISGLLPQFCNESDEKFRIYQSWTDDCAQSVCETLLGAPHFSVFLEYFQQCNFCTKCDQTVRDMHFFANQIEIFQKRIRSLIDEIQTLLLVNLQTGIRTKEKHLQTRIITILSNGPNSLNAYSGQQIAEIMYTIISNKGVKKSTGGLNSGTPHAGINQYVNSVSNMCEAKLPEVKEEQADHNDYIDDANDHIAFDNNDINPLPCSSSVYEEANANFNSIWNMSFTINKKAKKKKFKGKRKELPSRKTRNSNPVWKKADVGSDSEEEEIEKKKPLHPRAKANFWEEEVESDGSWTPPKKKIVTKIPQPKPVIVPPAPVETKEEKEAKRQEKLRLASEKYSQRKRDIRMAKKKEKSVICTAENCDKFFATKDELEGHYREIHEGNTTDPYWCGHCTEKFAQFKCLAKHSKARAALGSCIGKEECAYCGKLYTSVEKLNEHLSSSHKGSNPFTCAFCDHETTNSLELRKHVKEQHPNLGEVVCEECGERVHYRRLGAHKKLHSQSQSQPAETKEEHKCELCEKSYSKLAALRRHEAVIHRKGDIEILYCEVCGRECFGKGNLSQHMRFHNDERPYKCKICDRTFKTAGHCRDHEISHIGIRNFKCETCGKFFLTSNILRGHVLIHKEGYVPRKFNRRTKQVRRTAPKKRSESESTQETPVKNEQEESSKNNDIKEDKPIQQGTSIEQPHNSQAVPFDTVDTNDIYVPNVPVHYLHHPQPYYHPPYPYPYNPNIR